MRNEDYTQTLDEIFKYDGVLGVVRYFVNHEKLSTEEAKLKASELGYVQISFSHTVTGKNRAIVTPDGLKILDETKDTLFCPSSSNDEVTPNILPKEMKNFFSKLFGI